MLVGSGYLDGSHHEDHFAISTVVQALENDPDGVCCLITKAFRAATTEPKRAYAKAKNEAASITLAAGALKGVFAKLLSAL